MLYLRLAQESPGFSISYRLQFAEYTLYTSTFHYLLLFVLLPLWLPRPFDLQRGRVFQQPLT